MSNALDDSLVILPPDGERRVEDLVFSRSREVDISWDELLDQGGPLEETEDGTDSLRLFLEKLWGIDWEDAGAPSIDDVEVAKQSVIAWTSSSVIVEPESGGQQYVVHARDNTTFLQTDFDSPASYVDFWRNKVDRVAIPTGAMSEIEELDLAGPVILRQYAELDAIRTLAKKFDQKAEALTDAQIETLMSKEELDDLIAKYQAMKDPLREVKDGLTRLKDAASDLGYILNITEQNITYTFPGIPPKTDTIEPGKLYRPYNSWVSWTVIHYRRVVRRRRFLFWTRRTVRYIPYPVRRVRLVRRYAKIIVDLDPWVEKEAELERQGRESFRFEREGDTYLTANGETLEEILIRCEQSSTFWEKCVVWIPVYEQSLVEGEALVRYILIHRPLRGVESLSLPKFYLQESLSYKTKSRSKVELGSLVHTINLAPAERRTIAVERTLSKTRETTRTATSLIDLVDTTTNDFSTEFENEARREKEKTKSSNWNASASGGFGWFSGSAGGGGSSTTTVKQFAKSVSRIARKASRNVTRKTQEQLSITTSVQTTVTRKESTTIDLENNNDGRTLNLAFYQLNNVHTKALHLDGLSFIVFSGIESIGGSGLVLPKTFSLGEFSDAVNELAFGALPVRERPNPDPEYKEKRRLDYVAMVSIDILKTLGEYVGIVNGGDGFNELIRKFTEFDAFEDDASVLGTILDETQDALDEIVAKAEPIPSSEEEVMVGAVGLYVDSFVGARPSTEPYAEEMRSRELAFRDAEISEVLARADAQRSVSSGFVPPATEIIGVTSDGEKELKIEFRNAPTAGVWELWVETANTGKTFEVKDDEKEHQISFDENQAWLKRDSNNLCRVVHSVTRETAHFLV